MRHWCRRDIVIAVAPSGAPIAKLSRQPAEQKKKVFVSRTSEYGVDAESTRI
jgi:hypothetical protein